MLELSGKVLSTVNNFMHAAMYKWPVTNDVGG